MFFRNLKKTNSNLVSTYPMKFPEDFSWDSSVSLQSTLCFFAECGDVQTAVVSKKKKNFNRKKIFFFQDHGIDFGHRTQRKFTGRFR